MVSYTDGRLSRGAVYLEPELYAATQKAANDAGLSVSSWLRKLVLHELLRQDRISQEMLVRLAVE